MHVLKFFQRSNRTVTLKQINEDIMSELLKSLSIAQAAFDQLLANRQISDVDVEGAAGTGRLADGRSTPGDGTSNPGVNCTCCCN
jgi:hypothetical protein